MQEIVTNAFSVLANGHLGPSAVDDKSNDAGGEAGFRDRGFFRIFGRKICKAVDFILNVVEDLICVRKILKLGNDAADAFRSGGADPVYALNTTDGLFDPACNPVFNFIRSGARIGDRYGDIAQINLRKHF